MLSVDFPLSNKRFQYAMHGLGAYKGLRQTNTLEALQYWYAKGVRIFEIDIAITDDNQYVAVAHTVDQKSMKRLEILEEPVQYDKSWFMSQKLFPLTTKGLTPLDFFSICDLLSKYSDMIFMIDIFGFFEKSQTAALLNSLSEVLTQKKFLKDRILVEAYNMDMAHVINERGYQIIYCGRYEYDTDPIDIESRIRTLQSLNVKYVSYPWMYHDRFPGEIEQYVKSGINVFSRTKYNNKTAELKKSGVMVNIVACVFNK